MEKYLLYLLICHMITVTICTAVIEQNDNNSTSSELKETNAEHRRQLPMFPRNKFKFDVTTKPYGEKAYTSSSKNKMMTRMTVMPHVTPRAKTVILATTQLTSRKPIMKLRTFTIQSRTNGRYKNTENISRDLIHDSIKGKTNKFIDILSKNYDITTEYHKEPETDMYLTEETQITIKNQSIDEIHEIKHKNQKGVNKPNPYIFSSEEEDRNEFIFLENKSDKKFHNDMLGIEIDSEELFETTTERNVIKEGLRLKRSVNIIEEENIASTISAFKYTGRDTRLNNEIYFKNINS